MDISKKHGMEYRLLNAVTVGQPWYGHWGYKFGAGSFGVTAAAYHEAVNTLANLPLSQFFSHSRSQRTALQNTVSLYCSLSDNQLVTLRDLFRYITHLLHEACEGTLPFSQKNFLPASSPGVLSAWAKQDVEKAEEAMIKVLRAVGSYRWVTWRALRGAVSGSVGSPELLDYCLKGLGGKHTNDHLVVRSQCSEETNVIEFRLESVEQLVADVQRRAIKLSPDHLLPDLKSLYGVILDPTAMQHFMPKATRESILSSATKILDCKHFVKHYDESLNPMKPSNQLNFHIWCHVELCDEPADHTSPPPELVILPATATIADLNLQVAKVFRET